MGRPRKLYSSVNVLSDQLRLLNEKFKSLEKLQHLIQQNPNNPVFKQAIVSIPKALRDYGDAIRGSRAGFSVGTGLALGAGAFAAAEITARIAHSDNILKRALSINKNLSDVTDSLPARNFNTSINTELIAKLDLLEEGVRDETAATYNLALEMQVLGQDSRALGKLSRQAILLGGMTNEEMGNLSLSIGKASDAYGIAADKMIKAVQGFASDIKLASLGVAGKFSEAGVLFEGKFGQGSAKLMGKFLEELMSSKNFAAQSLTGTTGDISKLLSPGGNALSNELLIEKIIRKVGTFASNMANGISGPTPIFGQEIANNMLGGLGFEAQALNKLVGVNPNGNQTDPFATLTNKTEKMLAPLDKLANVLLPLVIDHLAILTGLAVGFKAMSLTSLIMGPLALAGPIGIGILTALGIGGLIHQLMSNAEEEHAERVDRKSQFQKEQADKSAESYSKINTNKYLELQSKSMGATLENIIYHGDLQEKLLATSKDQLARMENILITLTRMDRPPRVQMGN